MVPTAHNNAISVNWEYDPTKKKGVAIFDWGDQSPDKTYTIDVTEGVSLELDSQLPVRPSRLTWFDNLQESTTETIRDLFGEEYADAVRLTREIGVVAMSTELDDKQRESIAKLQEHSPSTPDTLREAAKRVLSGLKRQRTDSPQEPGTYLSSHSKANPDEILPGKGTRRRKRRHGEKGLIQMSFFTASALFASCLRNRAGQHPDTL